MSTVRIPSGSLEFVRATVTTEPDADGNPVDLDMTVQLAVLAAGQAIALLPATWEGSSAASPRVCRTTSPVDFAIGSYPKSEYTVYVKLTDSPEAPLLEAYQLQVY